MRVLTRVSSNRQVTTFIKLEQHPPHTCASTASERIFFSHSGDSFSHAPGQATTEFAEADHEVEFLLEVQEEDKTWRPATLYRSRVQGEV